MQSIIGFLCNKKFIIDFSYNSKGALIFLTKGIEYDFEKILKSANFQHLELSEAQAHHFIDFIRQEDPLAIRVSRRRYLDHDLLPNLDMGGSEMSISKLIIAYVGRIALRIYSKDSFYHEVQDFLRKSGKIAEFKKLSSLDLNHKIKKILLVTAFATQALIEVSPHLRSPKFSKESKSIDLAHQEILFRIDYSRDESKETPKFIDKRISALKSEQPISSPAFISSSHGIYGLIGFLENLEDAGFFDNNKRFVYITLIKQSLHRVSRYIVNALDCYSGHYLCEDETLAPPGTGLVFNRYFTDPKNNNMIFLANFCRVLPDPVKDIYSQQYEHKYMTKQLAKNRFIQTALQSNGNQAHHAARNNDIATLKTLVLKHPEFLNAKDKDGYTPGHLAALAGHAAIIDIIETGNPKSLSIMDPHGRTPTDILLRNSNYKV